MIVASFSMVTEAMEMLHPQIKALLICIMSRYSNSDCKVYVGDLGNSASKQEIEDAFRYYGPLRNVWVARNPPGFAFVEFEDARDAEDAIRGLDGRRLCGRRARMVVQYVVEGLE
ncbi:hypothetical protein NQ318_002548 [Aromia moschata]|uniref:RRM domain-containing protein n=1 Tax=Aromia moschata TaxID=1265417 RepID=A0AAV8XUB9_9CUCU|nr:hypothetical protein NQ318_002548 [Aromia moschata]